MAQAQVMTAAPAQSPALAVARLSNLGELGVPIAVLMIVIALIIQILVVLFYFLLLLMQIMQEID